MTGGENTSKGCATWRADLRQPFMCREGQVGAYVTKLQVEAQATGRAHSLQELKVYKILEGGSPIWERGMKLKES